MKPPHSTPSVSADGVTVLVVDDSRAQRFYLLGNLKKWGFKVLEAATGREALEICKSQTVDLVLSDWMMPEMDGLEFCSAFRALDLDYYGYFILLTSKTEKDEVARGLDVGADDFLSKPVNLVELQARIRAGLRLIDMERQLMDQNRRTRIALSELQRIYEDLSKDLIEAERLQHSLIPVRDRQFPNGRVALHLVSAGHVGGDLVGFFRFSEDRLGIYSIDVSGHGVSSALLTARLAGYMSSHSKEQNVAFERMPDGDYRHRSPEQVAAVLNARLLEEIDTDLYFTLAFADINLNTGAVSLVQAGHPNPIVLDATGNVSALGEGGMPVGLIEAAVFDRVDLTLNPGDRLMLYSDGITECEGQYGQNLGNAGLVKILKRHSGKKGLDLLDSLFHDLDAFAGERVQSDDISTIVFEFGNSTGG